MRCGISIKQVLSYHACVRRTHLACVPVGLQMYSVTAVFAVKRKETSWVWSGTNIHAPSTPLSDDPLMADSHIA